MTSKSEHPFFRFADILTVKEMPSAWILITCELGHEDQTVNGLNKLAGVNATRLAGAYEIIAKVTTESNESFTELIGLGVKEMKKIQLILTLTVVEKGRAEN